MDKLEATGYKSSYGEFLESTLETDSRVILTRWNSEEGLRRLWRSKYKESFYVLAHHFQPQINPLYCGIATAVIVLNAMRIPKEKAPSQKELEVQKPVAWGGDRIPFPTYSQLTLLNHETDKIKPRKIINLENANESSTEEGAFSPGLALDELKGIFEVYHTDVDIQYADKEIEKGSDLFREKVKKVLSSRDKFIVVNFKGSLIGTTTGGHISPLGAYDMESDSVLILDVAGHKNPWYWVPIPHLYYAMHVLSGDLPRGWLIVSDNSTTSGMNKSELHEGGKKRER